jgi:predicted permease
MRTLRRLLHAFRSRRDDADLREEIETHRSLRQDRLEQEGYAPGDAAVASRRALGNTTLAREDAREAWAWRTIDALRQDLRTVIRGLAKSPGFTIVAVGTLALGIGANTALFSLFDSLSLRTLPVRDPASLVYVEDGSWTNRIWQALDRHREELFDGAFAWSDEHFDTSQGGETAFVDGAYVSGRMFDVLGVAPIRGRALTAADDRPGGASAVAVISHRFWQQRFGGAGDVVGRRLTLNHVPFTIIGVAPAGFFGPEVGRTDDVMIPVAAKALIDGSDDALRSGWYWWLEIMARRKPGQTVEELNAAIAGLMPQLRDEARPTDGPPAALAEYMSAPLTVTPAAGGHSELRADFQAPLLAVLAVVGIVLLIACANIANLLLARAVSRHHELSVRLVLGASRWRLARLLLAESLVLAAAGAALGVAFAWWSGTLLVGQLDTWRSAVSLDLHLDWRVLGFTAALTALTAVVAGVAPALGLRRVAPNDALKDGGRTLAGDRRFTIRGALIVAQIALSLALVVAAGLFLRTFRSLSAMPLGFTPEPLVVADLDLRAVTTDRAAQFALMERLRTAAAAVPGVTSTATSLITPLDGSGWNAGVGDATGMPDRSRMTWMNAISPGWLETMGTRLVAGRDFEPADVTAGTPAVAIVNQAFASRFLKGSPIGQLVRVGGPSNRPAYRIVGVAADAVYRSPREGFVPTMYVPPSAQGQFGTHVMIAAAPGQRAAVERAVSAALAEVDPRVSFTFRTFDEYIHAATLREQLVAVLSTFFGALGLLLAAIGLYGIVSHAVTARRTEIGLRLALGASTGGIIGVIFRRVAVLLAAGLVFGTAASLWAVGFVQTLLFHVEARDPATFAAAAAVLTVAVLVAAWLPARRAARLDPARVLRES